MLIFSFVIIKYLFSTPKIRNKKFLYFADSSLYIGEFWDIEIND